MEHTERKLASIQRIKAIDPIPNADAIERATVKGWHLVVKKGEFNVGDLCVYCEIDSILPEKEEFEFLRPRKFRIKTIKLRKQISQGICFPLDILPKKAMGFVKVHNYTEGEDVTAILGVKKFEPKLPSNLSGGGKANMDRPFPSFIPKTDEERVQNLPDVLIEHEGTVCFLTEKLDGTSFTAFYKDGVFGVCSRNREVKEYAEVFSPIAKFLRLYKLSENNKLRKVARKLGLISTEKVHTVYWKVARELNIESILKNYEKNVSIQGEIIGDGIQGNKYNFPKDTHALKVFNIFLIDEYRYLDYDETLSFLGVHKLESVPIIEDDFILNHGVDAMVEIADGKSLIHKDTLREGIVIRAKDHNGTDRLSFKAISNKFLLKYGE